MNDEHDVELTKNVIVFTHELQTYEFINLKVIIDVCR